MGLRIERSDGSHSSGNVSRKGAGALKVQDVVRVSEGFSHLTGSQTRPSLTRCPLLSSTVPVSVFVGPLGAAGPSGVCGRVSSKPLKLIGSESRSPIDAGCRCRAVAGYYGP